jgi:hypothetical protein
MSLPFECDTILGSFAASGKTPSGRTASLARIIHDFAG